MVRATVGAMSFLLSAQNLTKRIGDRELFAGVGATFFARERVGLIGPNGAGKSTLLKILAGLETSDDGEVTTRKHLRLVYLPQVERFNPNHTVTEAALDALKDDPLDPHEKEAAVGIMLGKVGFVDPSYKVGNLSGGWQKRLAIARQIARSPDLLLLDEPTNHLDLEGIEWLENFLVEENVSTVLITHDRRFLDRVATRVIELDRRYPNGVFSADGGYTQFLERREAFFAAELSRQESLTNKARREKEWVSQSAAARTTKQTGRLKEADALFDEVAELKTRTTAPKSIEIEFDDTERKTKRLIVGHNLHKAFEGRPVLTGLHLTITPGQRLGLLGRNGTGKTTLLKLLAATDTPDMGTVTHARGVRILTFDQNRGLLDPNQTLRQALAPQGGEAVVVHDQLLHVASWAKRLRFRGDQLDTPVSRLSGGEQARVVIGRLMLTPADVLLLDEPTNDLDIPTLETLEESLKSFPGAVVLVTHDREMLDRICTQFLGFDGKGGTAMYADVAQWQNDQNPARIGKAAAAKKSAPVPEAAPLPRPAQKLSYNEQREFDRMEQTILEAEQKLAALQAAPVDAADAKAFTGYCHDLAEAQRRIDELYTRWTELEHKRAAQKGAS
jgi:ATP-binding cassette subfamily F protein uup